MPDTVQTISWTEIISRSEELASNRGIKFEPMIELVRFIASSRYADGMFAAFSNEVLCIGKRPDFAAGKDELRIRFDETGQTFTFIHAQRPDEKFPWSLSCPAAEWKANFERIVHKRLRWFHEG